ncbi:bifunctional adenosylcobinamide kinase/adenosylcobinamide-phosphate guanylyltransferase [Saccharospirillum impatiens]|uniref:bifunctional adenosylcobinamide kinase/adenosylcobinamide-phosphate guanylyltransferase n=1 Tax=Saccharospirillum impatiens TaxID=169438 RepID=UPI0004135305|nr:bifunctional adenosylcobinamide kinase/adenosylcobinamide-phosphate guanylyltransferase [Saccharospirillum impatiens]
MTVHLILGGARSGKSGYAERLALTADGPLYYLATAEAGDAEMAERLERHQAQRSPRFTTCECPLTLAEELAKRDQPGHTVLVDCLTLWLSNCLLQQPESWPVYRAALLTQLRQSRADILLVSNEVGQGIVPLGALNRRFVDEAGWLHQAIAAEADNVTWVVAGLPQTLK